MPVSLRLRKSKDLFEMIQMPIVMLHAVADSTGQVHLEQRWVGGKEGGYEGEELENKSKSWRFAKSRQPSGFQQHQLLNICNWGVPNSSQPNPKHFKP